MYYTNNLKAEFYVYLVNNANNCNCKLSNFDTNNVKIHYDGIPYFQIISFGVSRVISKIVGARWISVLYSTYLSAKNVSDINACQGFKIALF